MTAPIRFPRFFVTSPAPCPYLPGRSERKVFTELRGDTADELNEALGRIGFRRSQTVAYRPSCLDCQACVSVRVVAGEFKPSSSQILVSMVVILFACSPLTSSYSTVKFMRDASTPALLATGQGWWNTASVSASSLR